MASLIIGIQFSEDVVELVASGIEESLITADEAADLLIESAEIITE